MDAPLTNLKSIIDSLSDMENTAKTTFQLCSDAIPDIIQYSSDKYGDLQKLRMSMNQISERQKEMAALNHATMEISSLTDRSNISKQEAISRFQDLVKEFLFEEDIDNEQKSVLSSLDSYMHETQVSEEQTNDSELLVIEAKQSYKDPLTKRIMEDPVKSKNCNHAYERSSIIEYLGGSKKICPYSGCQSVVRREDLVDHFVLRMQLLNNIEKDED